MVRSSNLRRPTHFKTKKMDYSEKFVQFIKGIKKTDRVALFHDVDGDGIPAAAITINALKRLGIKVHLVLGRGRGEITPSEETIKELQLNKIDFLITLDKPTDKDPKALREISRFAKVLVVDHHSNEGKIDVDEDRVLIFKPQFFSDVPFRYLSFQVLLVKTFPWNTFRAPDQDKGPTCQLGQDPL